jgi:hypothetical protein
MLPSRSPSRGKIAVALGVSLALHAVGALAWLSTRGEAVGGPVGFNPNVEAPADEFAVTFLDPPKREFVVQPKTKPIAKPPEPLPPVEDVLPGPGPGPGAMPPSGPSPAAPESLNPPAQPSRILGGKAPTGTVVFVIDRSSSMGIEGMLPRAIAEAVAAIGQLDGKTSFQVVAYNGGATAAPGDLKTSNPDTRTGVERWLKTLTAEGRSDHRAGIREALACQPTHIFLLTDADDLEGREANELGGLLKGKVALDVVVFGAAGVRPASETPLERLVRANGGSVRYLGPE